METCALCLRPNATLACGLCKVSLCKSCEEYLEPESFTFLETVPEEANLGHYCPSCFDERIAPIRDSYNATMERAREVNIFFIADKHPPQLLRKATKPVQIHNCWDRDETILRLGFRAAEMGFNAVVRVDLLAKQIRNLTHQKNSWSGTGLPAQIDEERYLRTAR